MGLFKMKQNRKEPDLLYGEYPCNDYLNNAIRFLLKVSGSKNVDSAISEICYAIRKANGRFHDDVKKGVEKHNLFSFK